MVANKQFIKPKSFLKIHGKLKEGNTTLSFDSRKHIKGQGFLALKGENFDASIFAAEVLERGCPLLICHENTLDYKKYPQTVFIEVSDTLDYIQELSHLHLLDWKKDDKKVIGITGSNGKTTTKEMLYHLLDTAYPGAIHKTEGNFNNHLGVPFTLLGLKDDHQVAIVEMGTNHPGEIAALCKLACPDNGIITNIGPAHLEFFGTVEKVFEEKRKLLEYVKGKGAFVINSDDPFLKTIKPFSGLITFGKENFSCEGHVAVLNDIVLRNDHLTGRHNFENLAFAFLLSYSLFPLKKEAFIFAASNFKPRNNRSSWIEKGDKKFFLDAYNANPVSMKASLNAFIKFTEIYKIPQEDCLFILGDMNELGEESETFHQNMGSYLNELSVKNVAFLGKFSSNYGKGYKNPSKIYLDKLNLEKDWPKLKKSFKYFFLKGSRSLQLESLLDIN
jgi:UDP-N-acetylmuramoyl-tripeptide--D-alanyl-D-alanine ligase